MRVTVRLTLTYYGTSVFIVKKVDSMKQFYFSVSALCLLAACGGGEVTQDPQYRLSNIQVVNETHPPTKIISYDAQQNGMDYSGYVVTNNALSFTEGLHEALSSDDVEITRVGQRGTNFFNGDVIYDGKEYWVYIATDPNNNHETLVAIPVEDQGNPWFYGEDVPFFDDAVIRVIGGPMAPITSTGSATFSGGLRVIGGGGYEAIGVTLEVDFDSSSGVITGRGANEGPTMYALIDINNADGSFSSDRVGFSHSASISDRQNTLGYLEGHFTGAEQDGALGAVWSAEGEPQFKGLFTLARRD